MGKPLALLALTNLWIGLIPRRDVAMLDITAVGELD